MKNKRQHNILILSGLLVLSGCSVSNARSQSSDNGIDIESWGAEENQRAYYELLAEYERVMEDMSYTRQAVWCGL